MPKKIIDIDALGVRINSVKAMVNTLARLIGDEVYVKPVLEVESSQPVLSALDAVLDGMIKKAKKTKAED